MMFLVDLRHVIFLNLGTRNSRKSHVIIMVFITTPPRRQRVPWRGHQLPSPPSWRIVTPRRGEGRSRWRCLRGGVVIKTMMMTWRRSTRNRPSHFLEFCVFNLGTRNSRKSHDEGQQETRRGGFRPFRRGYEAPFLVSCHWVCLSVFYSPPKPIPVLAKCCHINQTG